VLTSGSKTLWKLPTHVLQESPAPTSRPTMLWKLSTHVLQEFAQEPHNLVAHNCDLLVRILDAAQNHCVSAAEGQLVALAAQSGRDLVSQLRQAVGTRTFVDRGSREQPHAETPRSHGLTGTLVNG
jgi:hypothetical protein